MLPAPPLYSCLDPDGGSSSSDASRLVKKAPLVLYAGEWAFFARPPLPSPYQSSSKALGWGRRPPFKSLCSSMGQVQGFQTSLVGNSYPEPQILCMILHRNQTVTQATRELHWLRLAASTALTHCTELLCSGCPGFCNQCIFLPAPGPSLTHPACS